MKGHRWFVLGLCFLLLNGYAVFRWLGGQRNTGPVRASLVAPEDGMVESGSRDVVRWRFSSDMVAIDRIGQWMDSGPVLFSPGVKGEFCWTAASELSFRPSDGWAACVPFAAVFEDDLRSLEGKPLDGNRTTAFQSSPLALLDVRQSNVGDVASVQLDFEFSQAVSPSILRKYLTVRDAAGKEVKVLSSGNAAPRKTIRVSMDAIVEGELEVTVRKGLTSTAGPLGLGQDAVRQVDVSRDLRVLRIAAKSKPFEPGQVEVAFNAPVDPAVAKAFLGIKPEMDFSVEARDSWSGRQYLRILGDFKAGEQYTVSFRKGLVSEQAALLEKDDARTVYFPWHRSAVEFSARGTYLSPQGNLSIPFKAVNAGKCSVKINRIYSNNLVQLVMRQSGRSGYYYGSTYQGLDQPVCEFELPVDAAANEIVERNLELRDRLDGKTGAFHIEIKGERGGQTSHDVVVSDLGLSLRQSGKDMLVWVNSIRTLDPVAGASVRILSEENQLLLSGETGADGLLRLDPEAMLSEGKPFLVVVEHGDDLTYMQLDGSQVNLRGMAGDRSYLDKGYEAFLFTDRGIYRPGETVHCKAVVRERDAVCPEAFPLELAVIRPDGKTDRTLNGMLGEYGAVEFTIPLADYVATGKYHLQTKMPGGDVCIGGLTVSVEEFVPPQIRTTLQISRDRIAAGADFKFKVAGQHLFGRPAAGMPVRARIDFMPCGFAPAAWADYAFGDARREFETVQKALGKKRLDADGEMEFSAEISTKWRPPAAIKAVVSGSVQESGGRTVTEYGSRIVDVYPSYVGIRRPDESLEVGNTHSFDLVVVAPDGSLVAGSGALKTKVEKLNWVTVLRKEGDHYAYRSEQQASEIESRDVVVVNGRASVEFAALHAGDYRLVVEDEKSTAASSLEFQIHAPGQRWGERSMAAPDRVGLELDHETYRVGDTARLSIHSPFPGKALLTVESDTILLHRVMELTNNTAEVKLPVEAAYRPNVYCSVSVVRPALPEEVWGQHRAAGRIPLIVEQPEKRLSVAMELPAEMRPGMKLEIPLLVHDAEGAGCKSEIVLAAVDEGICMLTGFKTPDPYDYFFGPRLPGMELHDLYARLMPEAMDHVAGAASAPGGGMLAAIGKRLNPIKARRFKPVALWSSSVETDTNGQARVVFDVPEFTGQLRVMAVVIDRFRFGSAEQSVLVKRPLVVQSSLPRFLAPEDVFTMPVRVYNESKQDDDVAVSVACEGPLECDAAASRIFLAGGSATNLEFHLKTAAMPGKAVCKLTAEMGPEHYVEDVEIAVRPAAPRTVFCGYGKVEAGTETDVSIPGKWLEGTGEASLWISALPAVKLGGSLDYLIDYPCGCLEQTTSKSFPLLYLSELVEQTRPGWLGKDGTTEFVNAGIYRILSMQNSHGGFSLWPNGGTYEWGSIYATHFLVEASRAGYTVPKDRLEEALDYVENKVRNASFDHNGWDYNASYGCLVLALGGRPQHGTMARLCEKWNGLRYDTRINLVSAALAAGQRRQAVELLDRLGGSSSVSVPVESGGSLRSAVRGNAFLLSALLDVDPENGKIPVLVRWLEDAQSNGRWSHTQDNAMALMALGKYTKQLAAKQKPVSGRVSWGGGAHRVGFEDREELRVALESLRGENVQVENHGEGDLFLCWKSEGVSADGETDEHDRGVRIRRSLLDLNGKDVDPMRLTQGELYIVKLNLSADRWLENMVIEDLLPAGLEVENSALKTSESVRRAGDMQTLPVQHLDIRDDRVLVFPGAFDGGKSYCYALRAVTVGEFVWPAVSASCMYNPEIESVSGKGTIRIGME